MRAQAARPQMWVQTWHPRHALYAALQAHDFDAFARSQLAERRAAGLPPFTSLALLRAEARSAPSRRRPSCTTPRLRWRHRSAGRR